MYLDFCVCVCVYVCVRICVCVCEFERKNHKSKICVFDFSICVYDFGPSMMGQGLQGPMGQVWGFRKKKTHLLNKVGSSNGGRPASRVRE